MFQLQFRLVFLLTCVAFIFSASTMLSDPQVQAAEIDSVAVDNNTPVTFVDKFETLTGSNAEIFRNALSSISLEPADVKIEEGDLAFFSGDKYRLPFVTTFFDNPWKLSPYSRMIADSLVKNGNSLPMVLFSAHRRTGQYSSLGLDGSALTAYEARITELGDNALITALKELDKSGSEDIDANRLVELPKPVKDATALFLFALPDIARFRNLAVDKAIAESGLENEELLNRVIDFVCEEYGEVDTAESNLADVLLMEQLADSIDWELLNTGGLLTALTVERMRTMLTAEGVDLGKGDFRVRVETPYGPIELSGNGDDEHISDDCLLIIDTEGNDVYSNAGAANSIKTPVSISIDLNGDDKYDNSEGTVPTFGCGVFGYGMLVDVNGNDKYRCEFTGQGCGIFGSGAIHDLAGNDWYNGKSNLQGCGVFGSGVLIDNAGDDSYSAYQYSQGFGFTSGVGILLDTSGNDTYTANDENIIFPSAQTPNHNSSMSQGAGMGRRADISDGHSWAGGVGMLIDAAGDDNYCGGVFSQGVGYWYGLGIFVDVAGKDKHRSVWYSCGASAHFAVAIMLDLGIGDDLYEAPMHQNLGNGRDLSLAWFEDEGGNDTYRTATRSLGEGDIDGIGVFVDHSGDDTYITKGDSLGKWSLEGRGSIRDKMFTLGMFLDFAGTDLYLTLPGEAGAVEEWKDIDPSLLPDSGLALNGTTWKSKADDANAYAIGVDS
jgi:hypothetical protein